VCARVKPGSDNNDPKNHYDERRDQQSSFHGPNENRII
jgi:hypothetical protein